MTRVTVSSKTDVGVCFREVRLRNRYLDLTVLPQFGCHWSRLRLSAKGEWLDVIVPVEEQGSLLALTGARGSFILAPWASRIADAGFEFDGRSHALRPNCPDGTAIHGDVRTRPWDVQVEDEDRFEATLDSRDCDDFNYPFALRFTHRLRLTRERLVVELETENCDTSSAPVGMGFHPYFRRRLTERDRDVLLMVPARKRYPLKASLPVGNAVEVEGAKDLRSLAPLGRRHLDDCYTCLEDSALRLVYAGTGVEVRVEVDRVFGHVIVYSPRDERGNPGDVVAVEPVSHAVDAFNLMARGWSATGVEVLEPGGILKGSWSLSVGDI
jgi:aldose 1-epimerase